MNLSRRRLLQAAAGAAGLAIVRPLLAAERPASDGFRFVHMTDIHVQPERRADQGLIHCLKAAEGLNPKPDFIFTGGDLVYDVFDQSESRATMLWDLYRRILADHTGLPIHHCIGNHDVFGWGAKSGVPENHAHYGKRMFEEYLSLPKTYRAFDYKGWRFYALDTIQPGPNNGYVGYLEDEQMAWLEADLKAKPKSTPALVVTHIPILTVTLIRDSSPGFKDGAYHVPIGGMCRDAVKLTKLFSEHNVRLALSRHIHKLDRTERSDVHL
jgi:Icc protein